MTKELLNIIHGADTLPMMYNSPNIIADIKKSGDKFYELQMLEAIAAIPYRKGICLDIGANTGNHTIFFSRFCNFDEVWSYEPNADTFEILKENVKNNCTRTVRMFNCAVGDRKGKVNFSNLDNPAINKVIAGRGKTTIIPITTDIKVRLMKIDVEGYEPRVIKGAYKVIERDMPDLFIETHGNPDDILALLPAGYKLIKRYNTSPTYHYAPVSI